MIHTLSNLYPLPPSPLRGRFNAQLFAALHALHPVRNTVPVAARAGLRAGRIRAWHCPQAEPPSCYVPYPHLPLIGRTLAAQTLAHALAALPAEPQAPPDRALLAAWLYPDGCAAAAVYGRAGLPVHVMVLGSDTGHLDHPARRKRILVADAHVRSYICVAPSLRERMVAAGLPAAKVHVIPNGTDTARFRPDLDAAARRRDGLCPEFDPLVLFCGNLTGVKQPGLALEAFARFAATEARGDQAGLVIIGQGELRSRLERQARALGIADRTRFIGPQPHDQMPDWYRRADALLLTSRTEGMPNVVAEAMACGTPVTATDVGACRAMLSDQPCCHIAPDASPAAVADALTATLRDAAGTDRRPTFTRDWHDMAREILAHLGIEQP